MDRVRRAKAKRVLLAVSMSWLLVGTWLAFFSLPADEVQTINSPEVQDRMRDECVGSFKDRYQCKEAIIVEVGQDAFANMALRLVLVVSVPLLAAVGYATVCRPDPVTRLPLPEEEEAWKPAHHSRPAPPPHPAPPPAETLDVAQPPKPNDDWKRRAQERTTHPRPSGPLDKPEGDE